MGVNPDYTRWSRIVIGLACALFLLIAVACWRSVEFINEQNDEGNKSTARDVGIYFGIVVCLIVTIGVIACTCATNNPKFQYVSAGCTGVFAIMFLALAYTQVDEAQDSNNARIFVALAFPIGFILFFSCCSSLRLAQLDDFDPAIKN
eukprot:maker-scaffold_2-snap-gene-27.3-mRNA-1 protein AED:0.00 eAED:0.00 QI:145/1/1/1/1/1/2/22/147